MPGNKQYRAATVKAMMMTKTAPLQVQEVGGGGHAGDASELTAFMRSDAFDMIFRGIDPETSRDLARKAWSIFANMPNTRSAEELADYLGSAGSQVSKPHRHRISASIAALQGRGDLARLIVESFHRRRTR
ncbi:MAG: hypothetical protein ACIAQ0_08395 [Phycisphaerales bacterium JB058]